MRGEQMKIDVPAASAPSLETLRREYLPPRDDITLRELVQVLGHGRVWILAITLGLTAAALAAAMVVPRHYQARAIIAVAMKDSRDSGLGSALAQLGGLAELTDAAGTGGGARAQALATLQSDILIGRYIREQNLLPVLYARRWDASKQAWKVGDPKKVPTIWQATEYFSDIRTVADDKKTGLIVIAVTWTDPVLAAKWANDLVQLSNDYMRQKAVNEAQVNMAYLRQQADKTNIVEMRTVIYRLMQEELKNAMTAQGNREFAFKVIDPAVPPEKPSYPKVVFWTLGGFVGGLLISMLFVVARTGSGAIR
jgi:uncharacterized protein involved in exopolysaccharide biosynthesis